MTLSHVRSVDLTRHKISCGEPERRAVEQKASMANTPSVDDKLARRQLHRLIGGPELFIGLRRAALVQAASSLAADCEQLCRVRQGGS